MAKFWKKKAFRQIVKAGGRAALAYSTGGASEAYLAKAKGIQSMFKGQKRKLLGQVQQQFSPPQAMTYEDSQAPTPGVSQRSMGSRFNSSTKPWWMRGGR